MKLDKAIEVVTEILADEDSEWEQEGSDALQLLIEAGKRISRLREDKRVSFVMFLPGETSEDEGGKP